VADNEPKAKLLRYLQDGREAVVWKLEGLEDYDIRRPLVRTGTNLLGLVKHLACVEFAYFGPVFGRPMGVRNPWFEDGAEPNVDMWATPEESREGTVGFYRRAWSVADATAESLDLDSPGVVPWWGGVEVTLHTILVHVLAETHRHAGHADLVRELIDGSAGFARGDSNMPPDDPEWWRSYRDRVEQAAQQTKS
jgi:hypothetical protein